MNECKRVNLVFSFILHFKLEAGSINEIKYDKLLKIVVASDKLKSYDFQLITILLQNLLQYSHIGFKVFSISSHVFPLILLFSSLLLPVEFLFL